MWNTGTLLQKVRQKPRFTQRAYDTASLISAELFFLYYGVEGKFHTISIREESGVSRIVNQSRTDVVEYK